MLSVNSYEEFLKQMMVKVVLFRRWKALFGWLLVSCGVHLLLLISGSAFWILEKETIGWYISYNIENIEKIDHIEDNPSKGAAKDQIAPHLVFHGERSLPPGIPLHSSGGGEIMGPADLRFQPYPQAAVGHPDPRRSAQGDYQPRSRVLNGDIRSLVRERPSAEESVSGMKHEQQLSDKPLPAGVYREGNHSLENISD